MPAPRAIRRDLQSGEIMVEIVSYEAGDRSCKGVRSRVIDHAKEFFRTIGMTSFTGYTSCTTIASILLCERSNESFR